MKKICIVSDAAPPQINGVVTTLMNVIHVLKQRGYEVRFIHPEEFKAVPVPFYPEIKLAVNPWNVSSTIKKFKPDAIHISTEAPLGLATATWCIKKGIPYSTSYHTNWPDYVQSVLPFAPEGLVYKYLKFIHNNSHNILVTNNEMKIALEKEGFKNITVWTRGVDQTFFNPSKRVDMGYERPIFLNVGRVSFEKNLPAFLDLDLPGTKMVVGSGPLFDKFVEEYPDVVFVGAKQGEDLAKYYASADVFVFPSKTDTFGMVLIEALASGLPVAAYPVTGPNEIVENGVNGILSNDLGSAAAQAMYLKKDAAVASSNRWSWDATTDIFLENLVPIQF